MKPKSKIFSDFITSVLIIFSILSFYTFRATTEIIVHSEEEMLSVLEDSIEIQMDEQLKAAELEKMLLPVYENIQKDIVQVQFQTIDS